MSLSSRLPRHAATSCSSILSHSCFGPLSSSFSSISPFCRQFSASTQNLSKIGRLPLSLPPGVTLEVLPPLAQSANSSASAHDTDIDDRERVMINGPLGSLEHHLPKFSKIQYIQVKGSDQLQPSVIVEDATVKHQRAMWGTTRACLNTNILGVSEGHACILRFVGVGYRASVETVSAIGLVSQYPGQKFINVKVGTGHPIEVPVPEGIAATSPQPTRLLLEGIDKQLVTDFAAKIREWKKPEPYKGKGIFINGETIKLKAKKIK